MGVTIGVARATRDDGAEELLRNADVAMYRAKQLGKGRYELFAPAMHAAVVERMALEADLRRALAAPNGDLRLVYQPIVALDTERIAGLEALARWHHPTRGPMSPDRFIPLAESTGLVVPLGRWVLHAACRHAALWSLEHGRADAGMPLPYVSVNISGRQLEHASLVDDVSAAVTQAGIDPSLLLLEITESVLMHRADAALRDAARPQGAGGTSGDRRLRHRLLVARVSASLPGRHPQDRQGLHRSLHARRVGRGARPRDRRARELTRSAVRGRGDRARAAGGAASCGGVRVRSGLLLRQATRRGRSRRRGGRAGVRRCVTACRGCGGTLKPNESDADSRGPTSMFVKPFRGTTMKRIWRKRPDTA